MSNRLPTSRLPRRSSRCSRSSPRRCPTADRSSTSRSGTGFARSCFAAARDVFIQSRDLRPLDRYFPELHDAFLDALPAGCVARRRDRDRDAARARLRRAAAAAASGRVARREAREGVAGGVRRVRSAGASADEDSARRAAERAPRAARSSCSRSVDAPIHLTPMTRDRGGRRASGCRASKAPASTASSPSRSTASYEPGKRAMIKVKHARTADCVVAGFRWHKDGQGRAASARCCSGCTTTTDGCTTSA